MFHLYDVLEKAELETEKSDQLFPRAEWCGDATDCREAQGTFWE